MRSTQPTSLDGETPTFAEVLAELLRPPYVWWLLIAMVLQAYTPVYIAPVAAAIVAATAGLARQTVQARRADQVPIQ